MTREGDMLQFSPDCHSGLQVRLHRALLWPFGEIICACSHHTRCDSCSVSLLSPVLPRFTRPGSRMPALPALPACLCVFMSPAPLPLPPLCRAPSEGYEKSRSLNNIAGMTANALRLSPVTSPYGSPCPLRRSRSPIPSILWDVRRSHPPF